MSSLVEYAEKELKRIGMIGSGEPYNDAVAKAILDLIELFASQGHSGFTAPYTANAFKRLAMFKPISPLTGKDDEWNQIEPGLFQNKRYSAVFKDKTGAYNVGGKVFSDDGGEVWFINRNSKVYIEFPYIVPDHPEQIILKKGPEKMMTPEDVWNSIEKLSELRSKYNCFDEKEEPYHRALSFGIEGIKALEKEPKTETVTEFADRCREWLEQEPKIGHCRECKQWRDHDGLFRRGVGAESKCPINRKEVFEGNGYCYMFEPREKE